MFRLKEDLTIEKPAYTSKLSTESALADYKEIPIAKGVSYAVNASFMTLGAYTGGNCAVGFGCDDCGEGCSDCGGGGSCGDNGRSLSRTK